MIVILFLVVFVKFLDFSTNHGEEIKVPDLSKMKLEIAEEKLDEDGLEVFLLDTVEFKPDFPPYTIVEQDPIAGSKVKDGRKIYVKLNAGGYAMVTFPDLKNKTFRQSTNALRALGLVEGELKYVPDLAKDIVLEVSYNGRPVKAGDNPRRASFLARMGGMPGPERKPNGEPTRLLLSLQAWGASSKADAKRKAAAISARNKGKK